MIVYTICNDKNQRLMPMEASSDWTDDIRWAWMFLSYREAYETVAILLKDTDYDIADAFTVKKETLIEIEDCDELSVGLITMRGFTHIVGIPQRNHDIKLLRTGDGC